MAVGTANTGLDTAYQLTTEVKVNIDDFIYMVSPMDTPLLTGFGADGLPVLSMLPVDETEFFWLHDEHYTPTSAVTGTFVTATTSLGVTAGDQKKFSTGDLIRINQSGTQGSSAEVLQVTGYSATTDDVLIVTRSYDGTTAVQFTATDVITILGTALPEGSDPENPRTRDRDKYSNFTQIFGPHKIKMSRTGQRVAKHGIASEWAYQVSKKFVELAQRRETAFLMGRKTNSTTTEQRSTGGVDFFVSTEVDTTSTELSEANLITRIQGCWDNGGIPDQLWANPKALADLNDAANTSKVRLVPTDTMRGRASVAVFTCEFGDITVVRNRWLPTHLAFGVRRSGVVRRVLDPVIAERLAKTGDGDSIQIVCEEGLQVKGEQHCFAMNALSY